MLRQVAQHSETRAHTDQVEQLMTEMAEEQAKNGSEMEEVHSLKDHIVELEDSLREAVAVVAELREYTAPTRRFPSSVREAPLRVAAVVVLGRIISACRTYLLMSRMFLRREIACDFEVFFLRE